MVTRILYHVVKGVVMPWTLPEQVIHIGTAISCNVNANKKK